MMLGNMIHIPKELYRFEKVEINKDSLKEDLIKVRLIFNKNVANPFIKSDEFAYNEDIRSYEVTNIDNGTQFKSNTEHEDDTNVGVGKGVEGKGGLKGKSVDHISSLECSCKCCN